MLNQNYKNSTIDQKSILQFIYFKVFKSINLDSFEYEPGFYASTFTDETILKMLNCYLNILEHNNKSRFDELKGENGFESDKVLMSFSKDLHNNTKDFAQVLAYTKQTVLEKYKPAIQPENEFDATLNSSKPLNPLDEYINSSIFKELFSTLKLNYSEKVLFVLALLNESILWLLPPNKDDSYKANIFVELLTKKTKDSLSYAKKINKKLINLGLFNKEWCISKSVSSYFLDDQKECSTKKIIYKENHDLYDYEQMEQKNKKDFEIFLKLIKKSQKDHQNINLSIQENDSFRQKNFLSYLLSKNQINLYELVWENEFFDSEDLRSQIFLQSLNLPKNSVLLITTAETEKLFGENCYNKQNPIKFTPIPIIFELSNYSNLDSDEIKNSNIDILFNWNFKYPSELNLTDVFAKFFYTQNVSPTHFKVIVDESKKYRIPPAKWDSITEFEEKTKLLSKDEFTQVFEQKFGIHDENNCFNPHYSLAAINASESVEQLVECLKNAEESQKGEYNQNSGVRCKIFGPSGTGKTNFVEMIAYEMHKPLITTRASDILGSYVGETEQNIKRIFEQAKKDKAILLIDEADSFLHSRGDNVNRHNDTKVNEFLIQMEKFPGILFCNTNLPDSFDKATDRRFHFKVEFKPLKKEGIKDLCTSYFGEFNFSDKEIQEIFDSGSVTPGDFGILSSKIRFISKEQKTKEYVLEELKKIVQSKSRSYEKKQIGFGY